MARYETNKRGERKLVDKGTQKLKGEHPDRGRAAIIRQRKEAEAAAEEEAASKSGGNKKAKGKGGS